MDALASMDANSATMLNSERFCGTFASVDKHRRTDFVHMLSFACILKQRC